MKTEEKIPTTLVPELKTIESREALAEGVMALLFRWGLEDRDQLALLPKRSENGLDALVCFVASIAATRPAHPVSVSLSIATYALFRRHIATKYGQFGGKC